MTKKRNRFGNYQCYCCGYYTLPEERDNSFEICDVCFWEDDAVQSGDPSYRGGANDESLLEARLNFNTIGASNEHGLQFVRPPKPEELE